MDPFDWTMNKNIYQRWQLWSHKARLALEAMEGDTEKTKISYLHHWLNGEGISKIKGWKNSKTLISQEDYDKLADKTGKYFSMAWKHLGNPHQEGPMHLTLVQLSSSSKSMHEHRAIVRGPPFGEKVQQNRPFYTPYFEDILYFFKQYLILLSPKIFSLALLGIMLYPNLISCSCISKTFAGDFKSTNLVIPCLCIHENTKYFICIK